MSFYVPSAHQASNISGETSLPVKAGTSDNNPPSKCRSTLSIDNVEDRTSDVPCLESVNGVNTIGTVKRTGKLNRKHSRASSVDRREIFQKYINIDSEHAENVKPFENKSSELQVSAV